MKGMKLVMIRMEVFLMKKTTFSTPSLVMHWINNLALTTAYAVRKSATLIQKPSELWPWTLNGEDDVVAAVAMVAAMVMAVEGEEEEVAAVEEAEVEEGGDEELVGKTIGGSVMVAPVPMLKQPAYKRIWPSKEWTSMCRVHMHICDGNGGRRNGKGMVVGMDKRCGVDVRPTLDDAFSGYVVKL
jgi:hypothetical protein